MTPTTTAAARIRRLLHPKPQRPSAPVVPFGPLDRPGLYLGHGIGGLVLANPDHHALVLGPPRSGKTTRLVAPALVHHCGPAVVTSTKGDLAAMTARLRSRAGRCWWWDPSGTIAAPEGVTPIRWSPLDGCNRWDTAVERAAVMARAGRPDQHGGSDAHWVERARALLAPLFHAAAITADGDLALVLTWLHRRTLTEPLAALEDADARRAADLLTGIAATDTREASGIFSTADSLLAAYQSDAALATTVDPNFDPGGFVQSTDTLYLCAPATTQQVHAPILVALLEQLTAVAYQARPWPPLALLLDEVAQVAPLPGLPGLAAEGGSQGVIVMAVLQDLSQARTRWGTAADGFLTLFAHKIVLPGIADLQTLRAVSALAGDIDVAVRSVSRSFSQPKTTTWSARRQPRLPLDAIANGRPGQALLITGTSLAVVDLPLPPLPTA